MKIRSITYFCNPGWPLDDKILGAAGEFLIRARSAYETAGYEVQTTRLATVPFPGLLSKGRISELPELARALEAAIRQIDVGYGSLGPAQPDIPRSFEVIPEALAASQNIFFGALMANANRGISLAAVRACAGIIEKAASITPDGFANLRFAALANVRPGAPFFPAAYHEGNQPAFAIATEAADLAVSAFTGAKTLELGRRALIAEIEKHGETIAKVARELSRLPIPNPPSPAFGGIDFSLAPFPAEAQSLGAAVERMGIPTVGRHGSLAAAAILTEAVERAEFLHAGFSGFMPPVLEDAVLAQRAAEGLLTVKDLLLYSAVCGTGLDTVPLPGDTTAAQIMPLLLDLCALALRLDKPLTARLMPVPGRKAGDPTGFDFAFFANSRVMELDSSPMHPPLGGDEIFLLTSNKKH